MSTSVSRTCRCVALGSLLACAALAAPLQAQSDRLYLPTGTRVRVTTVADSQPFTGNLLRLTSDTLAVAAGSGNALVQVPIGQVRSLDASAGRNRSGWAAGGALVGGLVGGVALGAVGGHDDPTGLGAAVGFSVGALLGIATGAIVGIVVAPERWRHVPLSGVAP